MNATQPGTPPAKLSQLREALGEAHQRTLELIADLNDDQMMGPRLAIVNPLRWEVGHVAWFNEYWLLRHLRGTAPLMRGGDELYNSAEVAHDTRWDLSLPSVEETLTYSRRVLDRVLQTGDESRPDPIDGYDEAYFLHLALFHQCMHAEAFTYTRQTLGYPAPQISPGSAGILTASSTSAPAVNSGAPSGDARVPGGAFLLGSAPGSAAFFFDNELQPHEVKIKPFSISRTAVTQAEFRAFVEDGGYERREWWGDEGGQWRETTDARYPVYWRREANGRWLRRNFDQWVPLEDVHPVLHVNWYEADAYCRWAGRRLPTEAEWEMAACAEPTANGNGLTEHKRRYPWGDEPPTPERANLDWCAMGCVSVNALAAGDSAFGCRQMIGNAWEWTATDFNPYPGFIAGPYKEYSAPWFGDHKVLRGGCWATRSHLIRPTYRNFYKPDRRDVWAGFRTCALSSG
ncbi:MAG TPA: selenoneine synthase SenA [Blastocatellia bacterium]|nr:selenoneine synthase SenA [Blastocatellia bacterium]